MKAYARTGLLCVSLLLFAVSIVHAGNIARDVREGRASPDPGDGGYFEVGIGLAAANGASPGLLLNQDGEDGAWLLLNGRYQYKGFFVEALGVSRESLTFGYNFWNSANWALDLVGVFQNTDDGRSGGVLEAGFLLSGLSEQHEFNAGIRATRYFGPYIMQYQALKGASSAHHGFVASAALGRSWQLRNWTLHAIVDAQYRSDSAFDHLFKTEGLGNLAPDFEPDAGVIFGLDVGVTFPVSERWVFRSSALYNKLPSDLVESPRLDRDDSSVVSASISFVF